MHSILLRQDWRQAEYAAVPFWKKETAMSHTLSMGSSLKLYPLEILTHTECRIFFAQRLKENVRQLQEEPEECDRMVEMLTIDEALRNRFDQLGLINTK